MKKNNKFLTFLLLIILTGCSTSNPKYREGEPKQNFGYPTNKEIEKSFYLLGDGGYAQPGGTSEGLIALKSYMDSVQVKDNYTMFLGDNIYPDGMPHEEARDREQAEYRLDAQLDAIEKYDGNVIFIPGNHDWYNKGIPGLERQEEYLEEKLGDQLIWSPKTGCGLEIIDISDDIQMIVIDSQWYLTNWDNHPLINKGCAEIKTREAMLEEVETELKKSQNKTIIIALHHPLYTNGVHGGQYNFNQHLYPTQKKIPVPILGSLVSLIRTTGGVSIQDAQNQRYKTMVNRLATLGKDSERLIFVAGHEHSLQYIINNNIKQIVSGSGSKATYATLSNDGLFSYPGQGFAVLDVFKDGSSWVSFYGNENNKPKLLYQKEVHEAPEDFDTSILPDEFPETITTSIYPIEETDKGEVFRTVWGERYRDLFGRPVEFKVADLDTLYGGLEPMRMGGGHQTVSLRVKDSLDREYNFRRVRKSAVQYIQAVAFKDKPVEEQFENTLAEDLMKDLYTASHPYAFMAVPTLAEAVKVRYTNPELYYLPKQKKLEKYNVVHGDDVYMIEERPEENWLGRESFGKPNHDIVSTSGMFDRLRRDEKYKLDEAGYVRARIFDMLIGDWDRHQDQWRWAEIEDEEGNRIFEPIPRDRDQVFSNFDGALFGTLRALAGFSKQFGVYGEDIDDVKWFNIAAIGLDRELTQNVGKETWMEQAKFIQENITDEVIDEAFSKLPPETQGETTASIISDLKGRRNNIIDITQRYYDHMATLAIVTGTDKDDHIDILRMENGETRITIYRIKDGEKADIVSDKIYKKEETKEIWVYGLDDDDIFEIKGNPGGDLIFVRVIGGHNNDVYRVAEDSGRKIKIYDHKTRPNTVESIGKAKLRFRDNYEQNTFDKDKKVFNSGSLTPGFGYNPDDGFKIGIQSSFITNGFKRNPFTTKHTFGGGYYFATNGFDLFYNGEFALILGNFNLAVGAYYTSPNFANNFFGFGNETPNFDEELSFDYNRTRISKVGAEAGFVRQSPFGSFFSYMATFEGIKVDETEGRFIKEEFDPEDPEFFERKYFAGLEGIYRYESYDNNLNPTRGMKFELVLGGKMNVEDTDRNFGYFKPYWEFYNALSRDRKLVLNSRAQAHLNMGDDYEFYQAAVLGGRTGLRGYRLQRFTGKSAFAAGGDLRYSFDQFKTSFLPFQIGIFGGYDIGRVWARNEDSNRWHDSYGGGFWVNSAEAISGTFSLFKSDEGYRFAFGFGLSF
ncbi:phosphoesterase [Antarcticibacterium flavum]|uniref:Phosphoesterase n=1 Tax=Antarcticibacterium flavum TaxID=2058175 RepID=A0A5B7WZL2_9FLAO|nr:MULTISPECIES: metallophosphoesterase [Antarcticibacterium]MCM4158797.1 phosphoesterase [Antarcticibacterium sp. W02-3]QCY68646.1 phosphoesterase [Antarcticibacterium flavum]